ncbi:methylated-DNA--[protein]-cysteine S-methyltransferase [Eubacteriaceae bacterium ES3]|nr:methylated-DNA--[protein]-cysteine S-methyltransferase [Eubacteriaceae bacterium ES3]
MCRSTMKTVGYLDKRLYRIKIVEESGELIKITFNEEQLMIDEILNSTPLIEKTIRQLKEYFAGERREFSLPMRMNGTDFQMKVWDGLRQIPYGRKVSYKELAELIGHPRAYRAVGTANHYNQLPIIIPCHRVIKSSGQLGGYSGGEFIKESLLYLEKRVLNSEQ